MEITDTDGSVIKTLKKAEAGTWEAGETKSLKFTWDTGTTMTGTYKARVIWMDGEKKISSAGTGFDKGKIIFCQDGELPEVLPMKQAFVKNSWNTGKT